MKIANCRKAKDADWDAIWASCDYATFFHSRPWALIWEAYTAGRFETMHPHPLLITFSDGKQALLPLSRCISYRGLLKRYVSSPAGTFGGWISADALSAAHAALLTDRLMRKLPALSYRLNPYNPQTRTPSWGKRQAETTSVLELKEDFEDIFRNWSKGHRAAVAQAKKYGVTVRQAGQKEEWRQYYEAYLHSVRRWGKEDEKAYRWRLFELMYEMKSPQIVLWTAHRDGRVIAGALCLYAKRHVAYWHGAALEAYFKMRPVNLLLYEAIRHAKENAYALFDFNPSGNLDGVRAFKKSFGTIEKQCPMASIKDNRNKKKIIEKSFNIIHRIKEIIAYNKRK